MDNKQCLKEALQCVNEKLLNKEDDLYRAIQQLRNLGVKADMPYGESKQTCREIYEGYKKDIKRLKEVKENLKKQIREI